MFPTKRRPSSMRDRTPCHRSTLGVPLAAVNADRVKLAPSDVHRQSERRCQEHGDEAEDDEQDREPARPVTIRLCGASSLLFTAGANRRSLTLGLPPPPLVDPSPILGRDRRIGHGRCLGKNLLVDVGDEGVAVPGNSNAFHADRS